MAAAIGTRSPCDLKHAASIGLAMTHALIVRQDRGEPAEVHRLTEDHQKLAERHGLIEQVQVGIRGDGPGEECTTPLAAR